MMLNQNFRYLNIAFMILYPIYLFIPDLNLVNFVYIGYTK
jgi:hypothetical protein